MTIGWVLLGLGVGGGLYTCVGYPALIRILGGRSHEVGIGSGVEEWPSVDLVVTLRNEAHQVVELLHNLLAIEYPSDRLRILIVSDASDDGTDALVRRFEGQGVELLRVAERSGKTRAEAQTASLRRGAVVVYADASSRVGPQSVKALVTALSRPGVGCASGVDLATTDCCGSGPGEAAYVSREMRLREAEARFCGITGASGCLYAVRSELSRFPVEPWADRDFAMVLEARERGYRAVSVRQATCYLPPVRSLATEYRRKVRTIVGGMHTLWARRRLLNPIRHGAFAWMLLSHKVFRWLLPWMGLCILLGASIIVGSVWPIALTILVLGGASLPLFLENRYAIPRSYLVLTYVATVLMAAGHALVLVAAGRRRESWEPSRGLTTAGSSAGD